MKVLLWTHNNALDSQISDLVSATGAILFREREHDNLLSSARREQPMLILLGPGTEPKVIESQVEALASHPDTRWTPVILLTDSQTATTSYASLLDRGAASIVNCQNQEKLLQAEFRALHRSALRLASLRSTRLTDEKTGFYHQNFLLDQLQVLCRKKRRDGISFCILFLELRGEESSVHKAALSLSNTVRGADLFGRWESELFAVLLPSSQPPQAHLLAERCLKLLADQQLKARAALVSSDSGPVEAEGLIEVALNTLDEHGEATTFCGCGTEPNLKQNPANSNKNRAKATVLFPSSAPKQAERLARAKAAISAELRDLELHWPREVPARNLQDPNDYLAGSDQARCDELLEFLSDPSIDTAWFGRGGYGVTRILRQLSGRIENETLDLGPKRWMGYSDISALFAFCKSQSLPIQCIHGPMVCAYCEQPNSSIILDSLKGLVPPIRISESVLDDTFSSSIWGGNLAVLASLCGTPWLPTPGPHQVIFLEDVDEPPYRVDRYLTQLYDAGFFRNTKNLFLGTFTGFEPANSIHQLIESRCRELNLTVLGQLPAGHSEPHTPIFLDLDYRFDPQEQTLYSGKV